LANQINNSSSSKEACMAIVGIDLGTTYSVIATPKQFTGKPFVNVRGVTVIKDESNRRLLPSVVGINSRGEIVVGHEAKTKAGKTATVMFAKRFMGQEHEFVLADKHLKPDEVSVEILRHLKLIAEKQMGEPIDEAVITVPAYFSDLQKQLTKQAGEQAGLNVSDILQEPVAAALMYCYDEERDPLTIMTYDLGGGTFDVALLRKEGGYFQILAFDGDRFLGGSDFDKRVAAWMVQHLQEDGCEIDIQPDTSEWRYFLLEAETAKEKLSSSEVYTLDDQKSGILDVHDQPIAIENLEITREIFEGLIRDYIEDTLTICKRAIATAGIKPKDIHEIVMVGGSSRIPVLARRLEQEFAITPKLVEPDLCVAIGAAIAAKRLGKQIGPLRMAYLPEVTSLPAIQIAGSVQKSEETPEPGACSIILRAVDGEFSQRQPVSALGGFIIPQVPLTLAKTNEFDLTLVSAAEQVVLIHRIAIRRAAEGEVSASLAALDANVLAKSISIKTVTGLHEVAEAGTPLPVEKTIMASTMDQSGKVSVPVYEGNVQIGEVAVDGIPATLPLGSRVEIKVTIDNDFSIDCQAYLPAAQRTGEAKIHIPLVKVPGKEELRKQYEELKSQAEDALAKVDRGLAFEVGGEINNALRTCQSILYEEKDPALDRAHEKLAEVETLLGKLRVWQPDPSIEEYEDMRQEIEEVLLPSLYRAKPDAKTGHWEAQLKAIVAKGEKAVQAKSDLEWADTNKQMERLRNRISEMLERAEKIANPPQGNGVQKPPDPHMVKLQLLMELSSLEETVRRRKKMEQLGTDIQTCRQELESIDTEQPNALGRLMNYYQGKYMPLRSKVDSLAGRVDVSASQDIAKGLTKVSQSLPGDGTTDAPPPKSK
jgi:molecular chaperone DnaK (HSP70)